jgi:hypothetical protein
VCGRIYGIVFLLKGGNAMGRFICLIAVLALAMLVVCVQKEQRIGRTNPFDPAGTDYHPPVGSGLVAYFPFTGNAEDESGRGNRTTVSGPVLTSNRFGIAGRAYFFDGVNDYIEVADTPQITFSNSSDFSISLWLKTSSSKANMFPILKYKSSANGYDIAINHSNNLPGFCPGAGIAAFIVASGSPACVASPINDDLWHHLAGIYASDSNKVTLYLDGIVQTKTGVRSADVAVAAGIMIGGSGAYSYTGSIDDVRIYNRLLTASEIDSLYHEGGWTGP